MFLRHRNTAEVNATNRSEANLKAVQNSTSLPVVYHMQLFAYSLLWTLLLPLAGLLLVLRIVFNYRGYNTKRLNRLGIFIDNVASTDIIWHCVSVGEVTAVTPLIKALLTEQPALRITVTTTTPTGAEQVKNSLGERVQHCYLPYDHPSLMKRLLKQLDPSLVLVTEVEVWPNLINQCRKRDIPTMLVNARMTERSAARYAKLGSFFSNTIQQLSRICAQSQADANRYRVLGATDTQLDVAGNLKFAIQTQSAQNAFAEALSDWCRSTQKYLYIAASTHAPEEQMIIEQHRFLRAQNIDLVSVIVPRHPQRFDDVLNLLSSSGLVFHQYSNGTDIPSNTDVVLVDAMGVMHPLLQISDVAFVGGSFAERGGHNALEPAVYGKPIVMGPSQYNNPTITAALEDAGALFTVDSQSELQAQSQVLLTDQTLRQNAGEAGQNVIQLNQGALTRHVELILSQLS